MKTLLLLILLLTPHANAGVVDQYTTQDLVCASIYGSLHNLSCVSRVSIRADELHAELLLLQIAEIKNKQLTNKKKPVSINN